MATKTTRLPKIDATILFLLAVFSGLEAAANPSIIFGIVALPLVLGVPAFFIRRPLRALFAYIVLLPIHSLLLTILLAQVGLPLDVLKLIASWKEALLVATFVVVVVDTLLERRPVRLVWVDMLALLWLGQVLLYFLFHELFFDWSSNLTIKAYGARDWLLYLFPYFIGRLVAVSVANAKRILKAILFMGVLTSLIGIIEYFFVPLAWHVRLGVPRYFREFLNLGYPDYTFGLPFNYWAEFAGRPVRRAVSTHLTGQGLAVPFLVIWPVVLYNYIVRITQYRRWALAFCGFALLLTITRMTIVVCLIQSLIMLWLLRKEKLVLGMLAAVLVVFSIAFVAHPGFQAFVVNTLTFRDSSSSARPQQWIRGTQTVLDHPFGLGLGSTGQTGSRFGVGGEGQEAGYFRITGALGIPGLLLFLGWFLGILSFAYGSYRRLHGIWQGVSLVTLIAAIGFLLNTLTGPVDQSPFTIYVFAWLAGLSVQYATVGAASNGAST